MSILDHVTRRGGEWLKQMGQQAWEQAGQLKDSVQFLNELAALPADRAAQIFPARCGQLAEGVQSKLNLAVKLLIGLEEKRLEGLRQAQAGGRDMWQSEQRLATLHMLRDCMEAQSWPKELPTLENGAAHSLPAGDRKSPAQCVDLHRERVGVAETDAGPSVAVTSIRKEENGGGPRAPDVPRRCDQCNHYRPVRLITELLERELGDEAKKAQVAEALARTRQNEEQLKAAEARVMADQYRRGQKEWGQASPRTFAYCAVAEKEGSYLIAPIQNAGGRCTLFTPRVSDETRRCSTCAHRVEAPGPADDNSAIGYYQYMQICSQDTAIASTMFGGPAISPIDNTSAIREVEANAESKRAYEVGLAFNQMGQFGNEPRYFDYCGHPSAQQEAPYSLCALRNAHGRCPDWREGKARTSPTCQEQIEERTRFMNWHAGREPRSKPRRKSSGLADTTPRGMAQQGAYNTVSKAGKAIAAGALVAGLAALGAQITRQGANRDPETDSTGDEAPEPPSSSGCANGAPLEECGQSGRAKSSLPAGGAANPRPSSVERSARSVPWKAMAALALGAVAVCAFPLGLLPGSVAIYMGHQALRTSGIGRSLVITRSLAWWGIKAGWLGIVLNALLLLLMSFSGSP